MEPFDLYEVTLDCPEPRALAEFYRRLLGWAYAPGHETTDPAGDEWLVLLPPRGGTRLAFQRSDAAVPPWRRDARVHLDVAVPALETAHEHLLACGARPLTGTPEEEGRPDDRYRVYADPVGHAFCATQVGAEVGTGAGTGGFVFDRFAGTNRDEPYPLYRRAREQVGVCHSDAFGVWVVTRDDDVRQVLTDTERFSSAFLIRTPLVAAPGVTEILRTGHPEVRVLLNEDPPEHTRTRNLVAAAFSPRRIRQLQPRIQQLAETLIDDLVDTGAADLVARYAMPLPLRVICELIGLPPGDAEQVRAWTEELKLLTSFGATPEQQCAAAHGSVAFERYLADVIDQRRRHGRDDLLTDLLTAPVDGAAPLGDGAAHLDTAELISLLITLIFGGHETTANLIGTVLLLLLRRPDLAGSVRADPDRLDTVIEETLRADPPVQGTFRRAVGDTELSGVAVPAGAQIFAVLASANRDPARFTDPERFDPDRARPDRHLAFGRGIHFCVGATLARLETRIAVSTLLRRIPDLRLAAGFRVEYPPNLLHRGPNRLDATWTRPARPDHAGPAATG